MSKPARTYNDLLNEIEALNNTVATIRLQRDEAKKQIAKAERLMLEARMQNADLRLSVQIALATFREFIHANARIGKVSAAMFNLDQVVAKQDPHWVAAGKDG